MKRVAWREGRTVVVELPDRSFTVGQMLFDPYMQFFNCFSSDAEAVRSARVEALPRLFCVAVVREFLKARCEVLSPSHAPVAEVPTRWIRPLMRAGVGFRGGDLIEFDPRAGRSGSEEPLIQDLNAAEHRDIIEAHELTNLRGGDEFVSRLTLCRAYGRNVDPFKAKVFDFEYST